MPSTLLNAYLDQRTALLRLFTRRAGDAALAEDVIQDLYLRVQGLDPTYHVDNPQAFLFRTANNIYLNRVRALSSGRGRDRAWHDSHHEQSGGDTVDEAPTAEDQVASRQQLLLLVESLKDLPPRTQAIFRLHKMDGLSQQDVARQLDISLSSVEKHLSGALRHLMARLHRRDGRGSG